MEVGILSSQHIKELCVICEEEKLKGIHLYTSFICADCEKDLINTETDDPKYQYYVQQLKKATKPEIYS
ncbi:sigma factor G inhibitor Gin [Neobacillus sp. LXY-4]|uniref:sigma factor G inhibitor Gin n=1 Tax=Neobacillus sp. LXY-4 TaxID=3379826 RepID=UPI003EDFD1FC